MRKGTQTDLNMLLLIHTKTSIGITMINQLCINVMDTSTTTALFMPPSKHPNKVSLFWRASVFFSNQGQQLFSGDRQLVSDNQSFEAAPQ